MPEVFWTADDWWIVVIGALSAMSCALVGCFLVLKKVSMMGDAISHTVLPGLAIAFLLTGSRSGPVMFAGAVVIGILTAVLVHALSRYGRLDEGASMGVVFTSLFAMGLILIRQAADHVDLDPGCVLYGALELAPWDTVVVAGADIPRAALVCGAALLVNLVFVLALFKELRAAVFDPASATAQGIPAQALYYALMVLVAVTCVASFEAVGSILVIAMLIAPAAAAHLLTDRLGVMLVLAVAVGGASALVGHAGALYVPLAVGLDAGASTAGMMAAASGLAFLGAFLFAPRQGLVARWAARRRVGWRIVREDLLGILYRASEGAAGQAVARPLGVGELTNALHGDWRTRAALASLGRRGYVARTAGGFSLTEDGLGKAREIVRSHRLWEGFLVDKAGVDPARVHERADGLEHVTGDLMRNELADELGAPRTDPHGRDIPPEKVVVARRRGAG